MSVTVFSKTVSASWHDGLFSSIQSILGGIQVSAETNQALSGQLLSPLNSQTMSLLQAPANSDSVSIAQAETVPPIVGDNALSTDMAAANDVSNLEPLNTQISTYIVQSDDTISSIALMFDISLDTIKQSNHLSGSTIKPGQSLIILPITGVLYTVVANDSLQKIAKKYSVNIDDILTYNDLPSESSKIAVGQQLIIPHGKPSASDITSYLARQKSKVPSFEPLLDPVWNWPSYPDYFACPVPRARLSQGLHGHNAVDLAISYGTPIHAAASGVVIISKSNGLWNGGYGNFVMIAHPNGAETLYGHMARSAVSIGEQVSQGQTIGYIGSTGESTGPHTHFEIRGAQNPFVDPARCY